MTIGKSGKSKTPVLKPDEYINADGSPTGMSVIGDDVRAGEDDSWWLEKIQHLLPPALRTKTVKAKKEKGGGDGFMDFLKR